MRLSVVVPCHNEEEVLPRLHEELAAVLCDLDAECEVLFVDDGSTDGTTAAMARLSAADPRVRYLAFSRNFGKEAAMLAGMRQATGDAVVLMDADLQHPPRLIHDMLDLYRDGVDQVVAQRTRDGDPWWRTQTSRLYYAAMNRVIDVPLADGQGDFRLISRRALDALLSLPEANRFSKGLFGWIGFPQATLHYQNVARAAGHSTWSFGRLVNYGLDGMLSFNSKPLRAFIWIGAVIAVLSVLHLLWLLGTYLSSGVDVPGYLTLVTTITLLGGVQILGLGFIGEYIGRIYYESKRRPHYVVMTQGGTVPTERAPST